MEDGYEVGTMRGYQEVPKTRKIQLNNLNILLRMVQLLSAWGDLSMGTV